MQGPVWITEFHELTKAGLSSFKGAEHMGLFTNDSDIACSLINGSLQVKRIYNGRKWKNNSMAGITFSVTVYLMKH